MIINRKTYEKLIEKEKSYNKLKKELEDLDFNHKGLEVVKMNLVHSYNKLEEKFNKLKNEKYDEIKECGFSVDFKKLNAFSIERQIHDNREVTSIGYIKEGENKIQEWILYCSRETHEALVTIFDSQLSE